MLRKFPLAAIALLSLQAQPGGCQEDWPANVPADFVVNYQSQGAWQDIGEKYQISAHGIELHTHKGKQHSDYQFAISKAELQSLYAACKRDYFPQIPHSGAIRDKSSEQYQFSWGNHKLELQDDAFNEIGDSQKKQWDDLNMTFNSFFKDKMKQKQ